MFGARVLALEDFDKTSVFSKLRVGQRCEVHLSLLINGQLDSLSCIYECTGADSDTVILINVKSEMGADVRVCSPVHRTTLS